MSPVGNMNLRYSSTTQTADTNVNSAMPVNDELGRRTFLRFLAAVSMASGEGAFGATVKEDPPSPDHVAWVGETLKRMLTLEPGMNREQLLRVFSTEGGISTALERTFVSRDCPYFKVDVKFKRAEYSEPGGSQVDFLREMDSDLIASISRPYLQFSIMD